MLYSCVGHAERMSNKCLVQVVYDRGVDGVTLKGYSRIVWLNVIESILKQVKGLNVNV